MNGGDFVSIALFMCIAATIMFAVATANKSKLAQQETIRTAIQAGQKLDEETIKFLMKTPKSPAADLRQGVITACLAVGFAFAALVSQQMPKQGDLATIIAMIAIIVGSIGIGQLIAWKVRAAPSPTPTEPS